MDRFEQLWIVLDRIISCAIQLAPYMKGTNAYNGREITLIMADFGQSCQFTPDLSALLFGKTNFGHRRSLETLGITFPNAGQVWPKKKVCIDITRGHPNLHHRFVLNAVQEQPAAGDAEIIGGDEQPQPEAAPAPAQVQPVPEFPKLIEVHHMDEQLIITKSSNNKYVHYVRLPKATNPVDTWARFLRTLPAKRLTEILTLLAGDSEIGVIMLTRLLFNINEHACTEGLRQCGAGVLNRMTPEQTLAFQFACGITASARIMAQAGLSRHITHI